MSFSVDTNSSGLIRRMSANGMTCSRTVLPSHAAFHISRTLALSPGATTGSFSSHPSTSAMPPKLMRIGAPIFDARRASSA